MVFSFFNYADYIYFIFFSKILNFQGIDYLEQK